MQVSKLAEAEPKNNTIIRSDCSHLSHWALYIVCSKRKCIIYILEISIATTSNCGHVICIVVGVDG